MPELNYIAPFFIVANLDDSIAFYRDKLGFELRFMGPENEPYFAILGRGRVELLLKSSGIPAPNHTRYGWARWDAFISAGDPDALFEEYHAAGVTFRQSLKDDDDGLRGFEVTDSDGYVLFFGRPNS